jgi:hypothetical protein
MPGGALAAVEETVSASLGQGSPSAGCEVTEPHAGPSLVEGERQRDQDLQARAADVVEVRAVDSDVLIGVDLEGRIPQRHRARGGQAATGGQQQPEVRLGCSGVAAGVIGHDVAIGRSNLRLKHGQQGSRTSKSFRSC